MRYGLSNILAALLLASAQLAATVATAADAVKTEPLVIQEQGSIAVGGTSTSSARRSSTDPRELFAAYARS
ncbi:hypothetical protein [Rhizobium vallis]|uniref:hypothetical protein n=1 Tax=Rhizobium vallis TaxID=634290 RepID=UPI001FE13E19|nr:hypothetical protein [Rhizobium vallis]